MVRSLVGSMLHYEARAASESDAIPERAARARAMMSEALAARDRSLAGPTAPARGLFLWNVEYYGSPTRPGRGDYWARGKEGEAAEEPQGPAGPSP